MYRPELKTKSNGLPIISNHELDTLGERLVADFSPLATIIPQEIDIDRFVVNYLKMNQDFQYLSHCGVYLGMTIFQNTDFLPVFDPEKNEAKYIHAKAGTVIIDNTLLEDDQEHRYRFTLGHEGSHFILHPSYFLNKIAVEYEEPYIRCRTDFSLRTKPPYKWNDSIRAEQQANRLSSAILMPKSAVNILLAQTPYRGQNNWIENTVDTLVNTFNVSPEAAFYRLKALDFVDVNISFNHYIR